MGVGARALEKVPGPVAVAALENEEERVVAPNHILHFAGGEETRQDRQQGLKGDRRKRRTLGRLLGKRKRQMAEPMNSHSCAEGHTNGRPPDSRRTGNLHVKRGDQARFRVARARADVSPAVAEAEFSDTHKKVAAPADNR